MSKKKDNIFSDNTDEQTFSEVFAKHTKSNPGPRDIFSGNEEFYKGLKRGNGKKTGIWGKKSKNDDSSSNFSLIQAFLIFNLLAITGLVAYMLFKPSSVITTTTIVPTQMTDPIKTGQIEPQDSTSGTDYSEQPSDGIDREVLDKAISWNTAEMFFRSKDFQNAHYIYKKLIENLPANIPGNDIIKDYLQFKMAICLEKSDDQTQVSKLFTEALQSPSPIVRGLANYRLAFLENENGQFLDARKRAYKTIALLKAFEQTIPPIMEGDCYFVAAEAITRQVLAINNASDALPGQLWADTIQIISIPLMDQSDLKSLLQTGMGLWTRDAMRPRIEKQDNLNSSIQWSAVSLDAPLEELLNRFVSEADMNLIWQDSSENTRSRSASMYLPNASQQYLAEVAAGSTGLIANSDGQNITIYNPDSYDNLEECKELLTKEAIAVWRKFLIRYRGDHKTPNAHFALGLLNDFAGETATALGEYKLVSNRYSSNPLAPFALLNSSILKTNLNDYYGARQDLTEIIVQYPDCKVVDQASLYLAEATMKSGLYDDAIKSYKRVYNLDLNDKSKRDASYGLGKCYFETGDFTEARKWFITAIELTENVTDRRLKNSWFMLGKCCIELDMFAEASAALVKAIDNSASREEYVTVILQLVKAEVSNANFVNALNILENVPIEKLSQPSACAVLLAQVDILRKIDMSDSAQTLVRRKIEFIADANLRAQLTYESARCYFENGDFLIARKEIADALIDLPQGNKKWHAYLLMANISKELGNHLEARDTCLTLLEQDIQDEAIRHEALNLLGSIYSKMNQYDKAALAYAGQHKDTGVGL